MQDDNLYGDDPSASQAAEPTKTQNLVGLTKNPKTSRVVIATVAAVVLIGGFAFLKIRGNQGNRTPEVPSQLTGAQVGTAPMLQEKANTGIADNREYQEMVAAAEAARASAAASEGSSIQPSSTTIEASFKPSLTPAQLEERRLAEEKAARDAAMAAAAANAAQAQANQSQQPQQMTQAQQMEQQQYAAMMDRAAGAMRELSAPRERGAQVFKLVSDQAGAGGQGTQFTASQAPQQGAAPSQASQQSNQFTLISAGQIEAARLDTAINTDVSGSFGATLVTGKFAGAKLIGTVQRRGEKAVMMVSTISFPEHRVTVGARAEILDADTSEHGTATDVDRKLFVKYGIKPLAAGFAAVAQYLQNSGTTVVVNGETVTSSQPELTPKRARQIIGSAAAGQVSNDADALDTTPTIRVARGSLVGVFFTQDVIYSPRQ